MPLQQAMSVRSGRVDAIDGAVDGPTALRRALGNLAWHGRAEDRLYPRHDPDGRTARTAARIVYEMAAFSR